MADEPLSFPTYAFHPVKPPQVCQDYEAYDALCTEDEQWRNYPYSDEERAAAAGATSPTAALEQAVVAAIRSGDLMQAQILLENAQQEQGGN